MISKGGLAKAFSSSQLFSGLSKAEQNRLHQALRDLRVLYELYDMSMDATAVPASRLKALESLRLSFMTVATLKRGGTAATAQDVEFLLVEAAREWIGEVGMENLPFEWDALASEPWVFIDRMIREASAGAELVRRAKRIAQSRRANMQPKDAPLTRMEWMVGEELPKLYESVLGTPGGFTVWINGNKASAGLTFVSDSLEAMGIRPKGKVSSRFSFETLKAFRSAAKRRKAG